MKKLNVKGIKREKNKVVLTLLDFNPSQVKRIFKGFRYKLIEDENPVVEIKYTKKNEGKLTTILNDKVQFIKQLESRFKQYELISTISELEIYPLDMDEIETVSAPIESLLHKFGDRFDFYVGHKMKFLNTIKSKDFKKTFSKFMKQSVDNFCLKGKYINLGFKGNRFILSGEKLRPAMKHFMKNG